MSKIAQYVTESDLADFKKLDLSKTTSLIVPTMSENDETGTEGTRADDLLDREVLPHILKTHTPVLKELHIFNNHALISKNLEELAKCETKPALTSFNFNAHGYLDFGWYDKEPAMLDSQQKRYKVLLKSFLKDISSARDKGLDALPALTHINHDPVALLAEKLGVKLTPAKNAAELPRDFIPYEGEILSNKIKLESLSGELYETQKPQNYRLSVTRPDGHSHEVNFSHKLPLEVVINKIGTDFRKKLGWQRQDDQIDATITRITSKSKQQGR